MDAVWLMVTGEDYEGGSVIRAHATEAGARAEAQAFMDRDRDYGIEWHLHYATDDFVIWRNKGCSWLEIRKTGLLP